MGAGHKSRSRHLPSGISPLRQGRPKGGAAPSFTAPQTFPITNALVRLQEKRTAAAMLKEGQTTVTAKPNPSVPLPQQIASYHEDDREPDEDSLVKEFRFDEGFRLSIEIYRTNTTAEARGM